jgi:RimJ/RimL family protein N-acetyltransferase
MSFDAFFHPALLLQTEKVQLRLLREEDLFSFSFLTNSPRLWSYFSRRLDNPNELTAWVDEAVKEYDEKKRFPFTVIEKATGAVCGSTSYGNISFYDQRIEIGWTWLGEKYLGSGINMHTKFLLFRFAFEVMHFERVEIKTDNLNERAKQAIRKTGAREEGILRSHMLMPGNRRRDSVYFSILKGEWEFVKKNFFKQVTGDRIDG